MSSQPLVFFQTPVAWCLIFLVAIGCRSVAPTALPPTTEPATGPSVSQELRREFDEWPDGYKLLVDDEIVVLLPDPGKIYLGGGWTAWYKHFPSGSAILLRRGFAEVMLTDGTIEVSESSEAVFGQRFEIGRNYKSREAGESLEAALRDPAVMGWILSSHAPGLTARITREQAVDLAFKAFRGGELGPRIAAAEEPRDALAVLVRWDELKEMPGVQCEGYAIGPSRTAKVPSSRTEDAPVWFVQFEARSRDVQSSHEFTWSNAAIDAETGKFLIECRTNQPRRVSPILIITTIEDADAPLIPGSTPDQ